MIQTSQVLCDCDRQVTRIRRQRVNEFNVYERIDELKHADAISPFDSPWDVATIAIASKHIPELYNTRPCLRCGTATLYMPVANWFGVDLSTEPRWLRSWADMADRYGRGTFHGKPLLPEHEGDGYVLRHNLEVWDRQLFWAFIPAGGEARYLRTNTSNRAEKAALIAAIDRYGFAIIDLVHEMRDQHLTIRAALEVAAAALT